MRLSFEIVLIVRRVPGGECQVSAILAYSNEFRRYARGRCGKHIQIEMNRITIS
jgi:hypothetical protein